MQAAEFEGRMISRTSAPSCESGFTMIEVMAAALLILLGLGGTLAMHARSVHILRSTRQALATSQMLQQRIEAMRNKPWPEISSAPALAVLMRSPTASSKELADEGCTEFITVSVPDALGGEALGARAFSLKRERGAVTIVENADLSSERMLLVNASVQWRSVHGTRQRMLRTILCRNGLTRCGVFGSTVGRPDNTPSAPSAP
jgi:hypothetical protein